MASTGHGEDSEERKRKRDEDSVTGFKKIVKKKKRGAKDGGLENGEPIPGGSKDPVTPSPYARLNINSFKIHQALGRGGFGKVVLASVPGRNTFMAVKMVTKKWDNEDVIMRERQILLAVRDCPFLCHLYAAQQSQYRAYFIMEYLSGGSLQALLKMCGSLNIDNVRFYTAEIVCGLQFLHGHNIVHRDIKPENIMLDADGHIRIIDLGLAKDGVTASDKIYGAVGTLHYMAPEVLLGQGYGAAVDWWSLGIVVFKMATGCPPFYNGPVRKMARTAIISGEPTFPAELNADVKHLVKKLLRKNPEKNLGVSGNIKEHPFFSTTGWEELEGRRAQPPFTPFPSVLNEQQLQWPENMKAPQPVTKFNYVSQSWARRIKGFGL